MITKILILILLMIPLISGIIFDQGDFDKTCIMMNQNFECKNSNLYTFKISFNYPFQNIPQVFITFQHIGIYVKTDLRIEVKDITTQDFSLHIACLTAWGHCILLKWYAIDDQRFQIINAFNNINFTQQTYQHKNKNVNTEIGLISVISHNYDEFNFKLKIEEITSDNVTVSLTKVPQNYQQQTQVGFQIILGPKEAFLDFHFINSLNDYEKLITKIQNSWFLTLYTGMGYPYTDAVRLNKTIEYQETSIFKYTLVTYISAFTPCSHSHGFLSHSISTVFYALKLQKLQAIQKSQSQSTTQISMHFLQNNQILDTTGEFYITLDKDFTEILIEIYIVCSQGKLIESIFYFSTQMIYKQNYQCSHKLKELVQKIYYSKQAPAYSELVINLQQNSCVMKQLLQNQKLEEAQIFSINLKEM